MTIRATNPTNLTGPTGPSFLDQSKATPADLNPEIFKSRNPERQPTEGTVSSDYLKRTREEDPWPPESSCAPKTNTPAKTATVTLSDCRIDTPTEDLATDQPFQMSCQATTTDGSPLKGDIRFKLYCTLPDGTEEFTNHTVIAKRNGERYCAEGTLFSPKKPVEWGAPLKYHVVAEHPGAGEKEKSGVADVDAHRYYEPLASWWFSPDVFEDSSDKFESNALSVFDDLIELMNSVSEALVVVASMASGYNGKAPKQHRELDDIRMKTVVEWLRRMSTNSTQKPVEGENPTQSADEIHHEVEFLGVIDDHSATWSIISCGSCRNRRNEEGYAVFLYEKPKIVTSLKLPCPSIQYKSTTKKTDNQAGGGANQDYCRLNVGNGRHQQQKTSGGGSI